MSAEESKATMRRYFGVFEQGNTDLLDELLAPDYVNHSPATPELPTGPEGVKGVVAMFRSGIPDLRVLVEDMIAEGEKVATRYTLEGTHEGELFGVAPTGQHLRACLVKVRVRMVSYALSYEEALSYRPLRCPVDPFAILPTHPKGPGKTPHPLLARCPRRHLLRAKKRLPLAATSP
jgi:predicted ester cyclase